MAGIFGSPPEPIFNSPIQGLSKELLQEWLMLLATKNVQNMNIANCKEGYFKTGDAAEFIFLACNKLKLVTHAKYMAIELFDKFMVKHVEDLFEHVQESSSNTKLNDWNMILDRVQNQMILRIVSCCQIASKLASHYKIISPSKARSFLKEAGHCYNVDSILQSELRVLKTLNYNVSVTPPVIYVETLLEILGYNLKIDNIKVFYGVCLKLMDMFYMLRQTVYENLNEVSPLKKVDFHTKSDSMLLSSALITASVYLLERARTDSIAEELSEIVRVPTDDILDFAATLVKLIIENESSESQG